MFCLTLRFRSAGLALLGLAGCDHLGGSTPATAPVATRAQIVKVAADGETWTEATVRASVEAALPQLIACWAGSPEAPCGVASLSIERGLHGHLSQSAAGRFGSQESRSELVCLLGIVSKTRSTPMSLVGEFSVDVLFRPNDTEVADCLRVEFADSQQPGASKAHD